MQLFQVGLIGVEFILNPTSKETEESSLKNIEEAGVQINEVPTETKREMAQKMNDSIKNDIIKNCGQDIYDYVMEQVELERTNSAQ